FKKAFTFFRENGRSVQHKTFAQFCVRQAAWLDDYALFMALKTHHVAHEGGVWNTWPANIAQRKPEAMHHWSKKLEKEVEQYKFLQYLFFEQWLALKKYANERGIQIVGDIPIFVAFDSADVWANPDLFFLETDGSPTVIAGVPPDYFSETGQRWGNPLYQWKKMSKNNYAWWTTRLKMCFTQADIVRIDHFRGFDAYWEIPASEPTAVIGRWVPGPGMPFFEAMRENLGDLPLIAEDLGVITPAVEALRKRFDFPGMKILQFGFGGEKNSGFLPHTFTQNYAVYTGTHDNETNIGWYQNASAEEQDHIRRYMAVSGSDIAWDMIRLAYASVANTAVATLQDLMNLDNRARMNLPGTASGNWQWRYTPEMLTEGIALRLAEMTEVYGRIPESD
ncbi:MAG: 4-alpha-glucanotransferase, partial [bacterium]|nr:4-alpha-glucanotransferase [bacterium]